MPRLHGFPGGAARLEKYNIERPTVSIFILAARIRSNRNHFSLVFPSLSDIGAPLFSLREKKGLTLRGLTIYARIFMRIFMRGGKYLCAIFLA